MVVELKEGSAFSILEQVYNRFGGDLTPSYYKVKNKEVQIESHIFSLIKGSSVIVHSVQANDDLVYNVIGDSSEERFLNFRFEYNADLMKNTENHIEGMDLQALGMAVYDTSYSFKTYNQAHKRNQWVSVRIAISQIKEIFLEFNNFLEDIFSDKENWVRYDILPLEVNLLLKDIFELDFNNRTPKTNSIVLARVIECLGYFYDRMMKKDFLNSNKVHPDDLKGIMSLRNKLINPYEPLPPLSELAKEYGYSLSKLKRDFQSIYGSSIKRFHIDLRLEKAKELLQNENKTITEISRLVGYNSVSKFSASFKKQFGITPKEASNKYN